MRNTTLCAISLLTISVYSFGQDTTQLKRKPYKLTIAIDKKSTYEEAIKATPYVLPDKAVQLYPGETVYIEVVKENGNIAALKAVNVIRDPTTTLTITCEQIVKKKVHESLIFDIKNPFGDTLLYKAKIFVLKEKKWVDAITYPIGPGLFSSTILPDIISSIELGGWSLKSN
jgi:hypothetical protein